MELNDLAKRVAVALLDKGFTISTAEECTCGLLGATIASQEYPERWYKGTMTAYTEEAINKALGVPSHIISANGRVSCQVAQQMSIESLYKFGSDISVGIVGYVDSVDGEGQISIARMHDKGLRFSYKKIKLESEDKGKNIEKLIEESLRLILEHLI